MEENKKISLSLSAFKTNLESALSKTRELGFDYCDLIAIDSWPLVDINLLCEEPDKEIERTARTLEKNGLQAAALNTALGNLTGGDTELKTIEKRTKAVCRFLKELNIPLASFYPGYFHPKNSGQSWIKAFESLCKAVTLISEISQSEAVGLFPEPHFNTAIQHPEQIQLFIDNFPELPLVYDPSHFTMQEIDLQETSFILDKSAHIHLRDAANGEMQAPFQKGKVNFDFLMTYLKNQNYNGFYTIEYLPGMENSEESIIALKNYLLEKLS